MNARSFTLHHLVGLSVLCGLLFFASLARVPFFNKGEPREALVVQELLRGGDWLFPLKRGQEIPSKPPLYHWFAALTSAIWGDVTEATVRFPSALFATLGIFVMYGLARHLFDFKTAFWAGVILATSVGYQSEAISARVDMTLSFFMTVTLAMFYFIYRGILRGERWQYGLYVLLGMSVLAKGPIGILLPGMIICTFLAWRRRWDSLSRFCFHRGVLLMLAIPLVWYLVALLKGGEGFFARQILHENLARFFVHGEGGTGHQKPVYYYLPYLFLDGLPWSLFLPFMLVEGCRREVLADERTLFLGLWVGIIFLFFSISAGKRSAYLLPLFPPLSLLIGYWLFRDRGGKRRAIGLKTVGVVSITIGFALVIFGWVIFAPMHFERLFAGVGELLRPKDQTDLVMVRDALSQASGWLLLPVLLSAGLWFVAAVQLFAANARAAAVAFASLSVVTGLVVQRAVLPAVAEAKSYKPFVAEVNRRVGSDGSLCLYGQGWDPTSVMFYHGAAVSVVNGGLDALQKRLRSGDAYCIMSERDWNNLPAEGQSSYPVIETSRGKGPDGDDRIVLVRGR